MNYEEIKKLMEDMGNSKIDDLNIEFPEGIKIHMKKSDKVKIEQQQEPINALVVENVAKKEEMLENAIQENLKVVTSPMVGTFYQSSSPNEKPFVNIGDQVKKGDTLCIVEAMKLMNEIESEYDGEIIEICVQNEEIVDFGKPLFKIKNL